mgnify:CR=1 FL=1
MGKRARKRQARAMREMNALAQEQFDYYKGRQEQADIRAQAQREEFEAFEFENPYEGVQNPYEDMDNVFEDMTVDLTAAEFQAEQGAQQRANILASLRGAAGSSGVAGLAQALANQGAIQAKAISADISRQERQNELLATQEASRIQQLERSGAFQADMLQRQGEAAVQAAEFGRESTLLAADYGLLAGAEQGLSQAMANQMSGMGMQASMYGSQSQAGASMFGSVISAGATIASAKIIFGCIPKGIYIDVLNGKKLIEDIVPGDTVIGYDGNPIKVLQKHCYKEDVKTKYYKVEFNNGSIVDVSGKHKIKGIPAIDIVSDVLSKKTYNGVELCYDLLTEDKGYRINNTPVNSMIYEMAEHAVKLKNK